MENKTRRTGRIGRLVRTDSRAKNGERNRHVQTAQDEVFRPSKSMRLFTAPELVELTVASRKHHWGQRVLSNQTGMVFGPRGRGKTFFALALAIAMASGAEFLGLRSKRPRRVIYLDGEMDLASLKQRVSDLSASLDVDPPGSLRIFTPEAFADLLPEIGETSGRAQINAMIGTDWDLLFVDNYSAWSGNGREDADAWAPVMRWMLEHKRAGRTVVMIHHANKNGGQRGSSRHEDALDFSISLQPVAIEYDNDALSFTLTWTKCRHLRASHAKTLTVSMRAEATGRLKWTHREGGAPDAIRAEALRLSASGATNLQIAKKLGRDRSTISRWLKVG